MSLTVTLLGTGSPMPSPDRAGPATLISAGEGPDGEHYLVDAGRGVLMRLAAAGLGAPNLAVPPIPLSGSEDDWRALRAAHFDGTIELGDDLHTVTIPPT